MIYESLECIVCDTKRHKWCTYLSFFMCEVECKYVATYMVLQPLNVREVHLVFTHVAAKVQVTLRRLAVLTWMCDNKALMQHVT